MIVKTISAKYSRKLNLGDFNSAHAEITLWADLDEGDSELQAFEGALDEHLAEADEMIGDQVPESSLRLIDHEPDELVYELARKYGYVLELWIRDKFGAQFIFDYDKPNYMTRFPSSWFDTVEQLTKNTIQLFEFYGEDFDDKVCRTLFIDTDEPSEQENDYAKYLEYV